MVNGDLPSTIRIHRTPQYTGYTVEGINFGRSLEIEHKANGCLLLKKRYGVPHYAQWQGQEDAFYLLAKIVDTLPDGYELEVAEKVIVRGNSEAKLTRRRLLERMADG